MVMRGYHNLPDATAEVLSADGWFATGDVGELDEAGRLRVTDRKKDLIKTSGGKYIAPQSIEVMFKAVCPLASQMVVHGDGRNYATALIALDPDALAQWSRARGLTSTDYATLVADPAVHDYVRDCVEELNAPAQPLGDDQGLPGPRPRHVGRSGRADAEHEGQAEDHRGEVPRRCSTRCTAGDRALGRADQDAAPSARVAPRPAVPGDQRAGLGGTPGGRLVQRDGALVTGPVPHHRVDDAP